MKTNTQTNTAPLLPLSAPVGVSGVTLPVLHGHEAIEYAREHGLTLSKYNDPMEDAREDLSPDQALEIAKVDPSLIYLAPPASPVDSVGVPAHTPTPWHARKVRTLIHIQGEGHPICEISISPPRIPEKGMRDQMVAQAEADAALIIKAVNSHAANLAKIQRLETALSRAAGCIEDISKGVTLTGSNLETWAKTAAVLLPREATAARAALALPSA